MFKIFRDDLIANLLSSLPMKSI